MCRSTSISTAPDPNCIRPNRSGSPRAAASSTTLRCPPMIGSSDGLPCLRQRWAPTRCPSFRLVSIRPLYLWRSTQQAQKIHESSAFGCSTRTSIRGKRIVNFVTMRLILSFALSFLLVSANARAELAFFANGRSLSVKGHRVEEDRLVLVLRSGGEIVCSPGLIVRITPDEVPYPEPEPVPDRT